MKKKTQKEEVSIPDVSRLDYCGNSETWRWYQGISRGNKVLQDKQFKEWLGQFAARIFPAKKQKEQRRAWLRSARDLSE